MAYDGGDVLRLLAGVHDQVARRVGGGQGQEAGADALVELGRLGLHPVRRLGEALAGGLRGDVEEHGQVRYEAVGGPAGDAGDLGGGEVAARALVGDGGVDVPVGDDDRAPFEGGADHAVDVLGAVGGEHQRLGAVGEARGGHVQDDRAQPLADGGGARLASHHDLVALAADPGGERLDLGRLPGAVAALQGDEEAGGGRGLVGVAAAQRLAQVASEGDALPVVDLAEHPGGDRQQQRADQHQGERRAAVREDVLVACQVVRADGPGEQRRDDDGQRDDEPDDRVQVIGRTGRAGRFGLLVQERVAGVGRDARRHAGEQHQQDDGGGVRYQPGRQQGQARDGHGEGQQAAPGQRGQHLARAADARDRTAAQAEDQQSEGDRSAAEVTGVQHGDGDGRGDRAGHRRAGQDQQRYGVRTAAVDAAVTLGAAQALQGGAWARSLRTGEFEEVQDRDGGGEEAGGHVRGERGLVVGEPADAVGQQPADQRDDDQARGGQRQRDEGGAQRQAAERVQVVRQRADGRAFGAVPPIG